jgi:hypothetical protein
LYRRRKKQKAGREKKLKNIKKQAGYNYQGRFITYNGYFEGPDYEEGKKKQ